MRGVVVPPLMIRGGGDGHHKMGNFVRVVVTVTTTKILGTKWW